MSVYSPLRPSDNFDPVLKAAATDAVMRVPLESSFTAEQALLCLRDDAHPFALVGDWAGGGAILGSEPIAIAGSDEDPFALLDRQPPVGSDARGAVGGGWFGWLGYSLGGLVERLPPPPPRPLALAPAWLAFYDHVLRLDASGQWWFEALAGGEGRLDALRARLLSPPPAPRPFRCDPFVPRPGRAAHARAVEVCKDYIAAGDLYQANLCLRLEGRLEGSGIDLFATASARLRPAYGAYVQGSGGELASLSPELFLGRRGREVVTRPIKGTIRRDADGAERQRTALAGSAKDRAENVMIVDLMRNDLGRTAAIGSVHATELAQPEAHPGVWHLVSEVRATLPGGVGDGPLVRGAFPPGSVTGAPKIKAMEVIATLESTAREAYTGAIGFASPLAGLELNVAIRTFEVQGSRVWLGAGGGIVADSDPGAEYDECLDKARPLVEAVGASLAPAAFEGATVLAPTRAPRPDPALGVFETVLVAGGEPLELEGHLARLARSARELYGVEPALDLPAVSGLARLRMRLTPDGRVEVETEPLAPGAVLPAAVAELRPIVVPGGLGAHKWVDRRMLAGPEPLVLDLTGEVLEAGAGAVVAVEGERLVTPPADGRLLPSVTLAALRAGGVAVHDEPLTLERLAAADDVLVLSALRRVQRAAPGEPSAAYLRVAAALRPPAG
jgi:para-aminobenzoate synthetase/4-amino-4-deoxychorismate lyase